MGTFAEDCARHFQFSREAQDAFATSSTLRALAAHEAGHFEREMVYLDVETRSGALRVDRDEQPPKSKISAIPTLKPAFASDGTVTAANSSSISDGAAALVLTRRSTADRRGLAPLARIVGHASHAQAPRWFTTAPAGAVRKLLERVGWRIRDVDLWEINEAFAVVTLAAMKELDLPPDRVNVHGGACALGHPIGATGARIVVTLIGALKSRGLKRGIATLCIGGGEATAIAIEMG
jgi:acetyl-CoA C-acetyltransferase